MGGSGRYLVNFFAGVLISEFRIKELVLNAFFPPDACGSISIKSGQDDNMANSGFLQISSISFFRDLMAL